ncbi:glutathione S-transferase [Thamnidium elegans]|uniref:Glutathione S-transferase n=1 Tax=Thamnidium elegans TaxID=101142 RepID=A0A8H7SJ90_9FUNG|nr:hypothetical protein INT48_008756 [Thamnidium elegans]KAI8052767.1 glutathione S-transferase [Thamnidium elegans]
MEKITLYYFLVNNKATLGLGENIKLLLEDAALEHEYVRLELDEAWNNKKVQLVKEGLYSGTLPYIEVGGKKFGRTVPIMRYISVKLGNKYHGANDEENQILDSAADIIGDWFESAKLAFNGSNEDKKKYVEVDTPRFLDIFERYLSAQEGPYILGEKISYSDFLIYHRLDDDMALDRLADYPNLTKFVQSFVERPNIKKHLASLSK